MDPELIVDEDLASVLIAEQFPDLAVSSLESLGYGWDNTAFLVNGEWVFRFPRRELSVDLIRVESSLLPQIASLLPLLVPEPEWLAEPSSSYPWPFTGFRFIPGVTACRASLSYDERLACLPALAQFLKSLHSIPAPEGLPSLEKRIYASKLDRTWLESKIKEYLPALEILAMSEHLETIEKSLELSAEYSMPAPCSIVHGDLYARHLILDGNKLPLGIIDWGDVHLGDPAVDLSMVHSFLPHQSHARFLELYGEVDAESWARARLRGVFSGLALAYYGARIEDPALIRESAAILDLVARQLFD